MNIRKHRLKNNNVPIGDGTPTDKIIIFDTGDADKPYLKYDADQDSLKFSATGLTNDEIDIIASASGLYTHNQSSATATWTIIHNLGTYPSITVVDSAGTVVVGNYVYDSVNQVTLRFSAAFSGKAYLN